MKRIGIFFLILFLGSTGYAQEVCPVAKGVELDALRRIPVLEEGRIKPLDSYARNLLLAFSGRSTYDELDAVEWLARLLFDSQRTREDQIFLINHPLIAETLGIEPEKSRRYSFAQLQEVFPKLQSLAEAAKAIDPKERDITETELIRVYESLKVYSTLSLSFAFALPHPDFTITDSALKQEFQLSSQTDVYSYLDIALRAERLQSHLQKIQDQPESQWTGASKEVISATSNLFQWSMTYAHLPLHFVPSYRANDDHWYAPWDVMPDALTTEEGREELLLLQDLVFHYWNGRQIEFDLTVKQLMESFESRPTHNYAGRSTGLTLELLYNRLKPFFWAKSLYLGAFIILMLAFLVPRVPLKRLSFALICCACGIQTIAIFMRILILQRPPVSNLYETFIFVSWTSVLSGLFIERVQKQGLGQAISCIAGFVFLMIASKFALEGDTLQMLVAVLNSNFWLSTHVISITIGYAGCCVAGIVGHLYILQAILQPKNKDLLRHTHKILIGSLGFGLTMAFLGTNLGGIWADQSWGRFWGWDPKENGALMIILWTALLFHARIGKMIGPLGLAVGSILGIIVVMWAWFGVNLLSVGLHSYGFTSGLAMNLLIYVALQILFLGIAYPLAKRKLRL